MTLSIEKGSPLEHAEKLAQTIMKAYTPIELPPPEGGTIIKGFSFAE